MQVKSKKLSVGKLLAQVLACVLALVIAVAATLMIALNMICSDKFPSAQQMFVTTILETGQLKFLASWFLSPEEIQEIVGQNSMKEFNEQVDADLIQIGDSGLHVGGEQAQQKDIEIVEVHHNRKVDAPSGTALMLYEAVKAARPQATAHCGRAGEGKRTPEEIGISSLRMGNVVGIHEVHIATGNQILTLRHEATNRGMFAEGGVDAARFVCGKPAGLYNMTQLLEG